MPLGRHTRAWLDEATRDELIAEVVRLREAEAATAATHARRVDDLLAANNTYRDRFIAAEAEVVRLRLLGADQATRIVALLIAARSAAELAWKGAGLAPATSTLPPLAARPEGEWR